MSKKSTPRDGCGVGYGMKGGGGYPAMLEDVVAGDESSAPTSWLRTTMRALRVLVQR